MMTKEEVKRELKKLAERLGTNTLIGRDLVGSPVSMYWVRHYYDHLADALVDAGLEPSRNAKSYATTNDELLDYLADLWSRLGRRPTTFDLKREGKYSAVIFKNRFGGFPEAIRQLKERERLEEPVEQEEDEPTPLVSEEQDWISNLLTPLEATLREREQAVARLTRENQEQLAKIEELTHASEEPHRETESLNEGKKIFVVHGRDTGLVNAVQLFCMKLELEPIILEGEPSRGSTVAESLERHADVAFAVVLLTPDDVGKLDIEQEKLQPRARQNVILELGYFWGKLGRERTCALVAGSVEKPSNISGVVYIPVDKGGAWTYRLANEMKAAGLPIDLNRLGT